MIPKPIRTLGIGVAFVLGGLAIGNIVSASAIGAFRFAIEEKRKKALACRACAGKGFYICKLCKGNTTIKWSPLYDPVCINPCLCPTCDGHRIQRCLNCIGKGYC
ncbi:PREDICTED: uncharacterized protein LOC104826537 isoform X2 [Tarenaya hassleriana]|uniref:uncharacterized protein LOC104826537 isoform X2 n=1 Tax=Tarenaya hassleriana TaxID=28532 RepID=UPI00053C3032|nr:PREDICTED: uncharacterized protein LOC104826537 isoform X2 [Tarenaya hassleriana]